MALVDQPRLEGMGREFRTAHDHVTIRPGLHIADRIRVEVSLDPGLGGGGSL
jgi:hypothetical protein